VLIGGKEDPVAVAALVGEIGQHAEPQQVGRGVKRQPVIPVQSHAGQDFLGDRAQHRVTETRQVEPTRHRISLKCHN
jgi:hypothetical protein